MTKNLAPLLALGALTCIWALSQNRAEKAPVEVSPVAEADPLSPNDILRTYREKGNATKFHHLYKMAVRSGATELRDPKEAICALLAGVKISEGIVYQMEHLTALEISEALSFVQTDGIEISLSSQAELNAIERALQKRENSCADGACGECVTTLLSKTPDTL